MALIYDLEAKGGVTSSPVKSGGLNNIFLYTPLKRGLHLPHTAKWGVKFKSNNHQKIVRGVYFF